MAQVAIRINGRTYDINCEDGQEQHVQRLANELSAKVDGLVRQLGQVGDSRLLVMAALLTADALAEARLHIDELERKLADASQARRSADAISERQLDTVTQRLDAIARRLTAP